MLFEQFQSNHIILLPLLYIKSLKSQKIKYCTYICCPMCNLPATISSPSFCREPSSYSGCVSFPCLALFLIMYLCVSQQCLWILNFVQCGIIILCMYVCNLLFHLPLRCICVEVCTSNSSFLLYIFQDYTIVCFFSVSGSLVIFMLCY